MRAGSPDGPPSQGEQRVTSSQDDPTAPSTTAHAVAVLGGRYELLRVLGSGGMAVVWLATDRVLDREVAVKVLRDQYAADPVFRARFTREALHAARLSHPGVVTTFDAGVDEGTAYLVMEVVHGRTLHEVLRADGPLPVDQAIGIAADVCDALDAAHRAGIVHRDIKPGNILIGDGGRTQVFDFGIARAEGLTALTQVSTLIGTPAYIAPEQAAGGDAGPQSDLYAVGCVLTEMLTGSPPFAAESPVAMLYQHIHDVPPVPSSSRPDVGADVDRVVAHLLAKDPADRPAGAAAARHALLSVTTARPAETRVLPIDGSDLLAQTLVVPAEPPDRPSPTSTADGRLGRWMAAAALVVAVAVIAFAVTAAFMSSRTSGPAPEALSTPSRSPVSVPPPTASPTAPSPSGIAVPGSATVAEAVAAFQTVVGTAQRRALVDARSAERLIAGADDVLGALDTGKGKPADKRARELADLVTRLASDGSIQPAAALPLGLAAARISELAGAAR